MKRRGVMVVAAVILAGYLVSWIPWFAIKNTPRIIEDLDKIEDVKAAIVFGGLHEAGQELTETNRERLLTAVALFEAGKVDEVVISNTVDAAEAMKSFLLEQNIPEDQIILDTSAVVTEDTCVTERNNHPEGREVVFVSHGYHLPRIIYVCNRHGISGVGVPAEVIAPVNRQELSTFETTKIRFIRSQREAILTLLTLIGIYGPTAEVQY